MTSVTPELRVEVAAPAEPVHEGGHAVIPVTLRDPSHTFVPGGGAMELAVDFGDGTPPETVEVSIPEQGSEPFDQPAVVWEGDQPGYNRDAPWP